MEHQLPSMNARKEFIEIADEQDRNYWATRLGVSGEKLKSAIKAIQSMEFTRLKEFLTMEKIKSGSSYQHFLNS
ncbi:DUF3606 domain-containing protein [Pedobacter endophyticus]|uniref:DUF3606 domain-containing protein n=1 Tax=Pedobacter endophyticus TaxID=2789740 RepID=A0A7S9L0T1_9SPHI|nr:DUF3606 domain-containing protein [Pedobacter endophyticus]QPH40404.1 DUF3606 domain-containing protein [Pedobacter endophyticus]